MIILYKVSYFVPELDGVRYRKVNNDDLVDELNSIYQAKYELVSVQYFIEVYQ